VGVASAALVLAIWTSFLLVARGSATRTLTAWDIAWVRFVFSGLVVLPWVRWRWRALRAGLGGTEALARGAALTATAGVGYCALAYSGFFYAPAAHAAVLLPGSLPLWTAVFAVGLLGERLTRARMLGLGLIVCGDLLVGGSSLLAAASGGGAGTWRGDLLFLAASGSWALYGVLCRRWRVGAIDATLAVAFGCLVSVVPLYALAVAAGAVPSRLAEAPWGEIAFQALFQGGLAMLVAGMAFTQVVATFGPVRTTMITAVVPVLAALAAVPLLGEPLGAPALGGLACVTLGLLLGAGLWPRPGRPQVALP
jgi:drug/metabolite transporter (DMT)-like permease